ncbi:MAG: acyl carrier protein [Acidobacteriota bacterium]
MTADEARSKIKEIISNVTSIPPEEIADGASFRADLDLDSLSLLEIGVDVDYEFKLGLPEERLQQLQDVQETVDLVLAHHGSAVAATT